MGAQADRYIRLAKKLISKNGRETPATFTRETAGVYSTTALTRASDTPVTYTCLAAPVDFNVKEIDKLSILSGQKMLWIPGEDINGVPVTPQVSDTVDLGTVYRVLEVTAYETQSTNCAYLLKIGA